MTNVPSANLRGAIDLSPLVRKVPGPDAAPSPGGSVTVPSLVVEADDASFGSLLELSRTVPVIVELHAGSTSTALERVIVGYGGRLVLARVDATANPQLAQAFQVVAAPTVAAVIGGRPLALYEGEIAEHEAGAVFDQVLAAAAQNGVTGVATAAGADPDAAGPDTASAEPVDEPLPPHHQDAFDAIERGDFTAAIRAYRTAIAQDPRDQLAVAGLAQVSLLERLDGKDAADIRSAGAAAPADVDAQLAVADLDVSGGHLDDAFERLLVLYPELDATGKDAVRTRLVSYFEIVGAEDPRVVTARRRLTALLY